MRLVVKATYQAQPSLKPPSLKDLNAATDTARNVLTMKSDFAVQKVSFVMNFLTKFRT